MTDTQNAAPLSDERLAEIRDWRDQLGRGGQYNLLSDAIHEIERLRAEGAEDIGVMRALRRHRDVAEAELALAQARIAAVRDLPDRGDLEELDPEDYQQAVGYNDGLWAATCAINGATVPAGEEG
jgi:hypothetical protein